MNWVEIDVEALRGNVLAFQQHVGPGVRIAPVVKSNAYGHDMFLAANALKDQVEWFAVANTTEALELRAGGITNNILVLSYFDADEIAECVEREVDLPIYDEESLELVTAAAKEAGKPARVHVKLDVGTTRIGFRAEMDSVVQKIFEQPELAVGGVYSHFSSSEENDERTKQQHREFQERIKRLPQRPEFIHIGCSAASVTQFLEDTNLVRLGLSTYGLWPSAESKQRAGFTLKPALSWYSRVVQVKRIIKGTSIGYGASYTAPNDMTIAVVACGYNEGLPRLAAQEGHVLINGKKAKILGRICMNLTMVDVSGIASAKPHDPVIIIGTSGDEQITAEDHAKWTQTINYEVTTRINPLIPRVT